MGKYRVLTFLVTFPALAVSGFNSPCCYDLQSVGPVCTTEIGFVTLQRGAATVEQQIGVSRGMGFGLKI